MPILTEHDAAHAFIEQYKLYVQSADNVSARRVSVNRYQASLNTAILTLAGFTTTIEAGSSLLMVAAIVGVCTSISWLLTILALDRLNDKKLEIIKSMETNLPRAICRKEWEGLSQEVKLIYIGANYFEGMLPFMFILLHLAIVLVVA